MYAPPGRETQVIFTLTESATNFIRVWVTAAPPGSKLRKELDESTHNRFLVHQGDGGSDTPWRNIFDIGGKYTFVAQEYTRGTAYGGGYQGSLAGAPSETKVGTESTLSLFIGQRMTSEISTGEDRATVVVWAWDETIRETSLAVHGEESPAIQNDTPTPRALAAMESAAVTTALLALRNQSVATAVGSASSILLDIVSKWNAHVADATSHEDADSDNEIPLGLGSGVSPVNLKDSLSEILPLIRQHYLNDAVKGGVTNGRDSGNYHNVGTKKNDNVNMPLVQAFGGLSDSYWALADLWRSYEAHRVSTSVHDVADSTNSLSALPLLLQVGLQFFTVLASTSPTVPPTQSSGAITLMSGAGFSETPL